MILPYDASVMPSAAEVVQIERLLDKGHGLAPIQPMSCPKEDSMARNRYSSAETPKSNLEELNGPILFFTKIQSSFVFSSWIISSRKV